MHYLSYPIKKLGLWLHRSPGLRNVFECFHPRKKNDYDLFTFVQLETKTGKAATASTLSATDTSEAPDLKVALKREREEHQHLLAESYAAVMDLTKQVNLHTIVNMDRSDNTNL